MFKVALLGLATISVSLASDATAQSAGPDPNLSDIEARLKGEAGKPPHSSQLVNGWEVGPNDDGECYAARSYERGTFLVINEGAEDPRIVTSVGNQNWSIVEGKKYPKLKFDFGGQSWTDQHSDGDGESHAIVSVWKPAFRFQLWRAEAVEITQDGRFIDRLSLDGLRPALSELTTCVGRIRAANEEAKRKRAVEAFPKDPFAKR